MIRANEMNWLDFGSMVKTPNLAFQDAVGVFQQNSCMKKAISRDGGNKFHLKQEFQFVVT